MRGFLFSKAKTGIKDQEIQHLPPLSHEEQSLINRITAKTNKLNRDNITRTTAYLNFYKQHPEIEWAFLAHMVSRNAGWNMTDLEGEFLPKLLSRQERNDFFHMLERGNWLIFHDAYPQLLLYQESMTRQQPLFNLLPYLHVSLFMKTKWEAFWQNGNRERLSFSLITNEQHYIEQRIIQNPTYQQSVLDTLEFQLQDLLSMNQILFPYEQAGEIHLLGYTVQHFDSLERRIQFGKDLYSLLFLKGKLSAVTEWAERHPHTGSRQDFWRGVFCNKKEALPGESYPPRFKQCAILYGEPRFYSPPLPMAWKTTTQAPSQKGDWYKGANSHIDLSATFSNQSGDIKTKYCQTVERLDWIISSKNLLFPKM